VRARARAHALRCVTLRLVQGKGIIYDTGGLSLKPTTGMCGMKTDMAGAAAQFGAFLALAKLGGLADSAPVPTLLHMSSMCSRKIPALDAKAQLDAAARPLMEPMDDACADAPCMCRCTLAAGARGSVLGGECDQRARCAQRRHHNAVSLHDANTLNESQHRHECAAAASPRTDARVIG
jgi:hypothetical protein